MEGDWESLPQDILYVIVDHISTLQDALCLSFVCKSWRSILDSAILQRLKKKKLPLLIVPYDHKGGGDGHGSRKKRKLGSSVCDDTLGFISLFDDDDDDELNKKKKKKKEMNKEEAVYKLFLPEIADRRICGSSEGWLVTVHENTEVQLLNPISRVLVHLPPLITAFPKVAGKIELILGKENTGFCYLVRKFGELRGYESHYFLESFLVKVVTNTTTTDANSTTTVPTEVMAIYEEGELAFCRPSEEKWICCHDRYGNSYDDVTFYKGNFYAVDDFGNIVVVKGLDDRSPFVETIIEQELEFYSTMNYLVESSSSSSSSGGGGGGGDLLKVMRDIEIIFKKKKGGEFPYRTIGFMVLKVDFNGPSWVEVTNLGEDCALFVGHNHSFSFSASEVPGCKGNCIYFTDNKKLGKGHDMGVYNLEDGSIESLYETSSQLFMPPPIWYVPNSNN